MRDQRVIIVGATSDMARCTAAEFARYGNAVALGARDLDACGRIATDLNARFGVTAETVPFEATDFDGHDAFLAACAEKLGGPPNGLLYFAGVMSEQAEAEKDFVLARRMIDVNFSACVSLCERFAAQCEDRGSGFLGLVSSAAGDRGKQSNYLYGATKGAMTTYAQGLRNRMHRHGVSVTTIKPGFVDTKMTFGMKLPPALTASAEQAGRDIYRAVARGKDVAYVRWFWRYIMMIIRAIPEWQFKKMSM